MLVLTCETCHSWQVRIFYDDPRFVGNIAHVRCPICERGISPELQERLRELVTRHHALLKDWKAAATATDSEHWTLGDP